jgi:hypothetical protein
VQGYVSCACFRLKKAKPHPHAVYLQEPLPGLLVLNDKAGTKAQADHEEWLYDACSHEFMQVGWEQFDSEDQLALFATALSPVSEKVPLLSGWAEGKGPPPAWDAATVEQARAEIDWVRASLPAFEVLQVKDIDSGEVLVETVKETTYCYCGDGSLLIVGQRGMALVRHAKTLFETQQLVQEELPDGTYRLTPEGGAAQISEAAFVPYDAENPDRRRPTPRRVRFAPASFGAQELEGLLRPLANLVKAAQATGNVIIWAKD